MKADIDFEDFRVLLLVLFSIADSFYFYFNLLFFFVVIIRLPIASSKALTNFFNACISRFLALVFEFSFIVKFV